MTQDQINARMRQVRSPLDWFLQLIPLFFILFVAWYVFGPVRTLEPRVKEYRVITQQVPAGGTLIYEVDACKYVDEPALVFRQLVDTQGRYTSLGASYTNLPKGCQKSLSTLAIPDTMPTGQYYLNILLSYQVNGFRNITVTVRTGPFTILPKEAK